MKLLQLLFIENEKQADKIYNDIYDRIGESVLPLVAGSYMSLVKGMRKDSIMYHRKKEEYCFGMENMIML